MSSISQFFGSSEKVVPSQGYTQEYNYLNNTEVTNPQGASVGNSVLITPASDDTFYVFSSQGGVSNCYLQVFTLNGDSTVTAQASLSLGSREPRRIVASGTRVLCMSWDGSRPIVDKVIWDGSSTLTKTQLSDTYALSYNETATVGTVLFDDRLLLNVAQFTGSSRQTNYFQMDTDGTTGQVTGKSTNFVQQSGTDLQSSVGHGDGIYIFGRNNNSQRTNGMKIYPRLNDTITPDSGEAYTELYANTSERYFSLMPMKQGGVVGCALSNDGTSTTSTWRTWYTMVGYNPTRLELHNATNGNGTTFGSRYIPEQGSSFGNTLMPYQRCYNGTFQDRQYRTINFDEVGYGNMPTGKNFVYSLKRFTGANSSVANSSSYGLSAVMGNRFIHMIRDNSAFRWNFNVWSFT